MLCDPDRLESEMAKMTDAALVEQEPDYTKIPVASHYEMARALLARMRENAVKLRAGKSVHPRSLPNEIV